MSTMGRGKGQGRRARRAERVDESVYFEVVAEGSPGEAAERFQQWLADHGLTAADAGPGQVRVKHLDDGALHQYQVHLDLRRKAEDL